MGSLLGRCALLLGALSTEQEEARQPLTCEKQAGAGDLVVLGIRRSPERRSCGLHRSLRSLSTTTLLANQDVFKKCSDRFCGVAQLNFQHPDHFARDDLDLCQLVLPEQGMWEVGNAVPGQVALKALPEPWRLGFFWRTGSKNTQRILRRQKSNAG